MTLLLPEIAPDIVSAINPGPAKLPFDSFLVHEVRNPLTNINLAVEILRKELSDHPLEKYLDIITRNSSQINQLVSAHLQYRENEPDFKAKRSVHNLLNEVLNSNRDRISLNNVQVNIEFGSEDCEVVVDTIKMRIALANIIVNAIESMPENKGQLTIISRNVADYFFVQIQDNGCGISKKNLKKIFIENYTSKVKGLGVGLAATYEILTENDVGIHVQSTENIGTCFTLLFPLSTSSS